MRLNRTHSQTLPRCNGGLTCGGFTIGASTAASVAALLTAAGLCVCLSLASAGAARAQAGADADKTRGVAVSSPASAKAQHEIEASVHFLDTAMEHKDIKAIDSTDNQFTDDYYSEDSTDGGPINRADRHKSAMKLISVAQTIHVRTVIEDFHLSADGKKATLTERTHLVFTTYPSKTEKSHTVTIDGSSRSVWVKQGAPKATWQKRSKKTLTMAEFVDGAPYKAAEPAAAPAATPPPS